MTQNYLEIRDDGERRLHPRKPNWFNSDGSQLTDSELIERENTYPVIDEEVTDNYDQLRPKPKEEWLVQTSNVIRTFWRVFENKPSYYPLYQNISRKDISQGTTVGNDLYKEGDISELTVDETKDVMFNKIAELRWNYETGGMEYTLDDSTLVIFYTDRDSQSKMSLISLGSKQGIITQNKKGKTLDGFKELTPAELERLGDELHTFIQSCYDNEERIINLIKGCVNYTDCQNVYDTEFNNKWPANAAYGG